VSFTQQVMTVLVDDRQRAVARDFADARNVHLRRDVAAAVYALAKAVTVVAVVLDDEPGTVRA
jgi:hypothetical protein